MFSGAFDISGAPAAAPTSLGSSGGTKRKIATPATAAISPADDVIEAINDKLDLIAELLLNLEARVRTIEAGLFVTVTGPKDCAMLADPKKALRMYSDKARSNKKHGMGSPHKYATSALLNAAFLSTKATDPQKKILTDFAAAYNSVDALAVVFPVCRVAIPYDKSQLKIKYLVSSIGLETKIDSCLRQIWQAEGCEIKIGDAPRGPQARKLAELFPRQDE